MSDVAPLGLLASMVGEWQGTAKTWFEPGQLGDESPIKGSTRLALDGTFLVHEYGGSLMGSPMRGLAIIGYSKGEKQWQVAWVDNAHNGTRIMLSKGEGAAPNVTGHYPVPGHPDWGWRTTLEMAGPDQLVIRHYNITPEGAEAIGVEIDYRRV